MSGSNPPSVWRPLAPLFVLVAVCVALLLLLPESRQAGGPVPQDTSLLSSTPLPPRKGADGPRFRRVRAAESGLSFRNELRKENTYTYLTNGAGLAVGDYDRDGLADVYLVSQDGPNRLYRQVRPFQFEDVTVAAGKVDGGAAWGTGATFADIDNDGDLDLYVCNLEAPNRCYRNEGNGTFTEVAQQLGIAHTGASMMASFADYDRDGDLDLYLLNNRALHAGWSLTPEVLADLRAPADTVRRPDAMVPTERDLRGPLAQWFFGGRALPPTAQVPDALKEHFFSAHGRIYMAGQPDVLYRNDGSVFRDVTKGSGLGDQGMGLSATWTDHDEDGWPDLYVANDLESPDTLWRNRGDGTFEDVTVRALPSTAYYGMGSDAADVDNDGRIDLFVADMSATTHRMAKVLMGDMDRQRHFLVHSRPAQVMRNALYHNTGTGRFEEVAHLAGVASTDWTWSALFGDLDNDGYNDLFATNGIARFDMNPDIEEKVRELWRQDRQAEAIAQIRSVPAVPERNHALRNLGNLRFQRMGADWGLDLQAVSHGAALVDLDRDGDLDVVVNNFQEEAGVWENVGTDGRAVVVRLAGTRGNRQGVGARVELTTAAGLQVREAWLSRGYLSGQEPLLHFGLGSTDRVRELVVRWPSGSVQTFTDLPVDRVYTVTEPATGGTRFDRRATPPAAPWLEPMPGAPVFAHREREFDDYAAQPLLPHKLSQLGPGLAFGDADGDGVDELYVGGAAGQPGALFRREGTRWSRVEGGPWESGAEGEDMGVLWFDADGDADQDLLVCRGGVEAGERTELLRDMLYRNEGGFRFVIDESALPDVRTASSSAAAADLDGDGDLDLALGGLLVPGAYPDAPPSQLLRNDGGRFTDVTASAAAPLASAGMVTSLLWGDVDGDADQDLLVAARWQPLRLLRNDAGTLVDATGPAGLAGTSGWWNGLAALDVDGDGDTDFVATNQGLNSKYKASPSHPTGIRFHDFDGNGTRDLVESKYEGDTLLPVRGRSCSSQAMPFLAQKFPTYDAFARSTLAEIYPRDAMELAGRVEAVELRSVLLRNDGAGRFAVEPLDRDCQQSPGWAAAACDLDGDRRQDVVVAQNFFTPEPETGRFAGGLGLLLRGTGTGLDRVQPLQAGLVAPHDGKGLGIADLDGDGRPDLAMAANDGPLTVWRNATAAEFLQLRLRGRPGNPTAVGARVTARWPDGATSTQELRAGGSWLSQSTAALWFAASPATLTVRWPDGTTTEHAVPPGGRALELQQP
ncbi:MAG: hypothetical protein RL148_312 [Planctomycetota bacterium]